MFLFVNNVSVLISLPKCKEISIVCLKLECLSNTSQIRSKYPARHPPL